MQIHWHHNPLRTTIHLNDVEKEIFKLKVKIEEFEEAVGMASVYLEKRENGKFYDPAKAYHYLENARHDDLGDREYKLLLNELENGEHWGDCTCEPASCPRCRAEEVLGIDTLKGLSKHGARKISGMFSDESRSLDDVIALLRDYEPVRSGGWLSRPEEEFAQHVPAWKAQSTAAANWLTAYRDLHFQSEGSVEVAETVLV